MIEFVGAEADAGGDDESRGVLERRMRLQPAEDGPGRGRQSRFGPVFRLQAELHDLELQRADGGEKGGAGRTVPGREGLDDTFLEELLEAGAVFFGVGRTGIRYIGEYLRRKAGNLVVADRFVLGQGVTDAKRIVTDESDHIARPSFIDSFTFLTEKLVGGGEAHRATGALMDDIHVALEFAGTDAEKRDAVTVFRVHVGLDLENEARELAVIHRDFDGYRLRFGQPGVADPGGTNTATRRRWHGVVEKTVEEELDAEIVHGGTEIDGGLLAGLHGPEVEGVAGAIEHLELFLDLVIGVFVELAADGRIVEGGDAHRCLVFAAGHTFEEVDIAGAAVEHALKRRAVAQRPDDRRRLQPEDLFELVEEIDRAAGGPVALVHEREDWHAPAAADLEELARLRLNALGGVNDHERGIHGGQHAVGVLGEVLVTRGVEQVDRAAGVVELEDGGADGDAALLLEFHPVGGGGALVFPGGDGAGEVQGVAVEQEFLRERGFARVGVGDDREGATAGDFLGG